VQTAGVPVTLGAGGEDAAILIDRDGCILFRSAPTFSVYPQVGSGNLAVRLQARAYIALLATAKAVGKSTGTGWSAPVWA
jgi:hypothetical protein